MDSLPLNYNNRNFVSSCVLGEKLDNFRRVIRLKVENCFEHCLLRKLVLNHFDFDDHFHLIQFTPQLRSLIKEKSDFSGKQDFHFALELTPRHVAALVSASGDPLSRRALIILPLSFHLSLSAFSPFFRPIMDARPSLREQIERMERELEELRRQEEAEIREEAAVAARNRQKEEEEMETRLRRQLTKEEEQRLKKERNRRRAEQRKRKKEEDKRALELAFEDEVTQDANERGRDKRKVEYAAQCEKDKERMKDDAVVAAARDAAAIGGDDIFYDEAPAAAAVDDEALAAALDDIGEDATAEAAKADAGGQRCVITSRVSPNSAAETADNAELGADVDNPSGLEADFDGHFEVYGPGRRYSLKEKVVMSFYERLHLCKEMAVPDDDNCVKTAKSWKDGDFPLQLAEPFRSVGFNPTAVPEISSVLAQNKRNRSTLSRIWAKAGFERQELVDIANKTLILNEVPYYRELDRNALLLIAETAKKEGTVVVGRISRNPWRRRDQYHEREVNDIDLARACPQKWADRLTLYDGLYEEDRRRKKQDAKREAIKNRNSRQLARRFGLPGENHSLWARDRVQEQKETHSKQKIEYLERTLEKAKGERGFLKAERKKLEVLKRKVRNTRQVVWSDKNTGGASKPVKKLLTTAEEPVPKRRKVVTKENNTSSPTPTSVIPAMPVSDRLIGAERSAPVPREPVSMPPTVTGDCLFCDTPKCQRRHGAAAAAAAAAAAPEDDALVLYPLAEEEEELLGAVGGVAEEG